MIAVREKIELPIEETISSNPGTNRQFAKLKDLTVYSFYFHHLFYKFDFLNIRILDFI